MEPVLRLREMVRHPVVMCPLGVAKGRDTHLLANEATGEGCTAKHHPLDSSELATAEVRSHAWSRHANAGSSGTAETHGDSEFGPATLSLEELVLGEEEAGGILNDLISSFVRSIHAVSVLEVRGVVVLQLHLEGA